MSEKKRCKTDVERSKRTETGPTGKDSSLRSRPKSRTLLHRISPASSSRRSHPPSSQSPLRQGGGAGPYCPAALSSAGRAGPNAEGERREGLPGGGDHVVSAHYFFTPLSFFTRFSFQTGKSVPRSGGVLLPLLFLPDPGPSSRPGARWWGARWKPLYARERGARDRSRGGTWPQSPRAHPEAPRPARPRSVGCARPSPSQAAAERGGAPAGHRDDPSPPPLPR